MEKGRRRHFYAKLLSNVMILKNFADKGKTKIFFSYIVVGVAANFFIRQN